MKKSNKWVIILSGLVIITMIFLDINATNKAINNCINNGQKESICEELNR